MKHLNPRTKRLLLPRLPPRIFSHSWPCIKHLRGKNCQKARYAKTAEALTSLQFRHLALAKATSQKAPKYLKAGEDVSETSGHNAKASDDTCLSNGSQSWLEGGSKALSHPLLASKMDVGSSGTPLVHVAAKMTGKLQVHHSNLKEKQ